MAEAGHGATIAPCYYCSLVPRCGVLGLDVIFQLLPFQLIQEDLLYILMASDSLMAGHVAMPQTPATALCTPENPAPVLLLDVELSRTPLVVELAT